MDEATKLNAVLSEVREQAGARLKVRLAAEELRTEVTLEALDLCTAITMHDDPRIRRAAVALAASAVALATAAA